MKITHFKCSLLMVRITHFNKIPRIAIVVQLPSQWPIAVLLFLPAIFKQTICGKSKGRKYLPTAPEVSMD